LKFFIATANNKPHSEDARRDFIQVAERCRNYTHQRTENADEADVIIFADIMQLGSDWKMDLLRNHPLVRKYPNKSFVYDECDVPRDFLPGVYVSMPKTRFNKSRHRILSYRILANEFSASEANSIAEPDYLFSFQGRRVGDVRSAVLDLKHSRALIEDTSHLNFFDTSNQQGIEKAKSRYRETILNSKFVLCPEGAGTSSLRLFETMGAGRVPVVISDRFVFPDGINWESCSIQVPEKQIASIPQILEAAEENYVSLAKQARHVYEEWFAPEIWFHRLVEHCLDLQQVGELGPNKRFFMDARLWRQGVRQELGALKAKVSGQGRVK
jgi:hypothetical protein